MTSSNMRRFSRRITPRIKELYDLLYIKKYSPINPQFTTAYIENAHRQKLIRMRGLRDGEGVLQGVVGCFVRGGVMTVPIVGYNTALPQRTGLYRMLMSMVLQEAAERSMLLHLSSGAPTSNVSAAGSPPSSTAPSMSGICRPGEGLSGSF